MRSGVAGFAPTPPSTSTCRERYTDPFGNETTLAVRRRTTSSSSRAPTRCGNTDERGRASTTACSRPRELEDANGNLTEVVLRRARPGGRAGAEGQGRGGATTSTGYDDGVREPELARTRDVLRPAAADRAAGARAVRADARQRDDPLRLSLRRDSGSRRRARSGALRPAGACGIVRERHDGDARGRRSTEPAAGRLRVLRRRRQRADEEQRRPSPTQPGGPLRWIVNGKTVRQQQGQAGQAVRAVLQRRGELPRRGRRAEEVGVTPLMYYDAPGRLVRTELPDGTFSRVEFSPWHVTTFDASDTVYDPDPGKRSDWYRPPNGSGASAATRSSTTPTSCGPRCRRRCTPTRRPARSSTASAATWFAIAHNRYADSRRRHP